MADEDRTDIYTIKGMSKLSTAIKRGSEISGEMKRLGLAGLKNGLKRRK